MFVRDLALIWAFLSTFSAALSTAAYLYFIHRAPWAAEFIQLYSTLGMVSGWLNALIYYLSPRSIFLQSRRAAVMFYVGAIVLTAILFRVCFQKTLDFPATLFLAANFLPVLYANAFGVEFFEGNYPWPYKRAITMNFAFVLATAGALLVSPTREGLMYWTGGAGLLFLLLWSVDRWNQIDVPSPRTNSGRAWLNPSLPVLERTLWDQLMLSRLGALEWSFFIYLIGRLATFMGNVAYSYIMGTNSRANYRRGERAWMFWLVVFAAIPVALLGIGYVWCAFLFGQVFAWFLTAELSNCYQRAGSLYRKFLLVWVADFAWRSVVFYFSESMEQYARLAITSGGMGIIAAVLLWPGLTLAPFRRTTSTKFRPADFPSKH